MRILILILLLSACGGNITHQGLTVIPYDEHSPSLEDVREQYNFTQDCLGIYFEGPVVEFTELKVNGEFHQPRRIKMNHVLSQWKETNFKVLRHEFVHYLLFKAGRPYEAWAEHQDPGYLDCSGLSF